MIALQGLRLLIQCLTVYRCVFVILLILRVQRLNSNTKMGTLERRRLRVRPSSAEVIGSEGLGF